MLQYTDVLCKHLGVPLPRANESETRLSRVVHATNFLLAYHAAYFGWERIGEIISPLATTTTAAAVGGDHAPADAGAGGAGAGAAKRRGGRDEPLVASSTPIKWVLVGHSMGTGAIEAVISVEG